MKPAPLLLAAGLLAGCAHFEPRPLKPAETAAQLEARSLRNPALRAFVENSLHRQLSAWPPAKWDEELLTLVAFYYHPNLDVARAQWGVAKAGVRTAAGRPNPVVTIEPGSSLNYSGTSPWFPLISVDIPLETAGKRGYRIAQAQHLSAAARFNIAAAAWQVRANLRASLLDLVANGRRAELLQRQVSAQRQINVLLEQRLAAGAIGRNELTLPRIALTKAEADYAAATQAAAEARVRLAEALGLPAQALEGVAFELNLTVAAEAGRELTSAQARQEALLGRADILSALAEYAAGESLLQLELAKQYPDIHLNPGYQFDEGEHKWSLGLSAELPVLNRNQGPIAEAEAKREESAARFLALQAKIMSDIDSALAARAAAFEQAARQEQLNKLNRQQLDATEALIKAGAADKLDLASAQIEGTAGELAFLEAQIKAHQALAQLEDALQHPLPSWPSLEQGRGALTQQKSK